MISKCTDHNTTEWYNGGAPHTHKLPPLKLMMTLQELHSCTIKIWIFDILDHFSGMAEHGAGWGHPYPPPRSYELVGKLYSTGPMEQG